MISTVNHDEPRPRAPSSSLVRWLTAKRNIFNSTRVLLPTQASLYKPSLPSLVFSLPVLVQFLAALADLIRSWLLSRFPVTSRARFSSPIRPTRIALLTLAIVNSAP